MLGVAAWVPDTSSTTGGDYRWYHGTSGVIVIRVSPESTNFIATLSPPWVTHFLEGLEGSKRARAALAHIHAQVRPRRRDPRSPPQLRARHGRQDAPRLPCYRGSRTR